MSTLPSSPPRAVLAVDPGRDKTGLALVGADGSCLRREVFPTGDALEHARAWAETVELIAIAIGDRTGSQTLERCFSEGFPDVPLARVDEHRSTEIARKLFLRLEPPRGWTRLLPPFLRSPDRSIDDYAAWILGRRYLGLPDEPEGGLPCARS